MIDRRFAKQRPLVVELVGPAGAGKSTLAKALNARGQTPRASIWGLPALHHLVNGLLLLPTCLTLCRNSRSFLFEECKYIVRLKTLHQVLRGVTSANCRLVVLDEGPVFALAWLFGFGHEIVRCPSAGQWWRTALNEWAMTIDAVVFVDAPDPVLARRIRMRDEPHRMKDGTDQEICQFIARWRTALEHVIAELAPNQQGPIVFRVITESESADEIVAKLLGALEGGRHGA